jgi:Spy/CpxP family protein refolding chaperone
MKNMKSTLGIIVVLLTIGIVAVAYADSDDGPGYGGYMMGPGMMGYGPGYGGYMMGYGPGYGGPMMGYGPGYGHHRGWYGGNGYADLSKDEAAKLDQARQKFYDETRKLRSAIRDKRFALNDELQNDNPDNAKVMQLQKELSQLQSEFDQKALSYQLEVRKILPQKDVGRAYGRGYGRGFNRGGYCW